MGTAATTVGPTRLVRASLGSVAPLRSAGQPKPSVPSPALGCQLAASSASWSPISSCPTPRILRRGLTQAGTSFAETVDGPRHEESALARAGRRGFGTSAQRTAVH